MMTEQGEEKSLKRKRTQRSRQGPSSTTKRRRAEDDHEDDDDDDVTADAPAQAADSLPNGDSVDQETTREPAPRRKTPKHRTSLNGANSQEQGSPGQGSNKALTVSGGAVQALRLKASKQEEERNKGWSLSRPVGGRFLSQDPKFSSDGQYLFAAKKHQLQALSVEGSLVYKTISTTEDSAVCAFAPSRINPDRVYIGLSSPDRVEAWDLDDNTSPSNTEAVDGEITQLALGRTSQEDEEALYILSRSNETSLLIRAGKTISKTKTHILDFCISGDVFVAVASDKLIIGKVREGESYSPLIEWDIHSQITSFGVRKHTAGSSKKKHGAASETRLSIALGTATGEIFVYDNVLVGDRPSDSSLPAPRMLHWHREAVGSVKWSRDGNYLITGGAETTLVIWQLATGKKQFLPHLTAEIEHITVSPSGTSYALQLADNSIMVLSTTELKPTAHFPDLQAQVPPNNILSRVENSESGPLNLHLVCGFHPLKKDELHVVIPPSTPQLSSQTDMGARPFVQAFDISSGRHLYRQALSRNKVTDLNAGPEGTRIQEPDVYQMQLNFDGSVMATIESWEPPSKDYKHIFHDKYARQEQTRLNRETYLKFWHWSDAKNCWSLQSRISNPHPADASEPGRVLDLVADRSSSRFFTIGEDATVRCWTPRKASRGVSTTVQDWSSKSHICLRSASSSPEKPSGTLALSLDSSLLAATSSSNPSTIHILTSSPLTPLAVLPPVPGHIHSLAFTAKHLFVLSTEVLSVFSVPTLTPISSLALPQPKPHIPFPLRHRPLAVSGSLAAIATPTFNAAAPHLPFTQLEIIDTARGKKSTRYRRALDGVVAGVWPDARVRNAWVVVMGDSSVLRLVGPREDGAVAAAAAVEASGGARAEIGVHQARPVVRQQEEDVEEQEELDDDVQLLEGEKPVVRPEQLARLFQGAAVGAMPVRAMFEGVMDLFVPKPVAFAV